MIICFRKDGKVICHIPIQVEDIETGAMFLYNSDENLAIIGEDAKIPLVEQQLV